MCNAKGIVREIVERYLKDGNWHLSDGVDDCSGWDEDGMKKDREGMIGELEEIVEGLKDEIEEIELQAKDDSQRRG